MRITITGTPGVGKTTVSRSLASVLDLPLYNLSELVKEKELYTEKDEDRDAFIVDEKKLLEFFKEKKNFKVLNRLLSLTKPRRRNKAIVRFFELLSCQVRYLKDQTNLA